MCDDRVRLNTQLVGLVGNVGVRPVFDRAACPGGQRNGRIGSSVFKNGRHLSSSQS